MLRRANFLRIDQRGAAAAEMALILPLALALLFTTFEGAYYMICEHQVIKGVRNAARYAARLDLSHFTCPSTFNSPDGALANIQNLARTGQLSPDATALAAAAKIWGNDPTKVKVIVTCTANQGGIYAATGGNAPLVTVRTRVAYQSMLGAMGFTNATIDIGAEAQSPVIGI